MACVTWAARVAPVVLLAGALLPGSTRSAVLITDLFPGAPGTTISVYDANDDSRVVGQYRKAIGGGKPPAPRAFTWAPGSGFVDLGLPGYPFSYALAVNDAHLVVGTASDGSVDGDDGERMFSWTPSGGIVDLGAGTARDVNASGQILFSRLAGRVRTGYLLTPGAEPVPMGPQTFPEALSDTGQVAGNLLDEAGYQRGFSWTAAGGIVDLGIGSALDVNGSGTVVGERRANPSAVQLAFAWSAANGLRTFRLGNDYAWGADVSERGQVVGWSYVDGQERAMSWTAAGGPVDLGALPSEDPAYPNGCGIARAQSVDDLGRVVGDTQQVRKGVCWRRGFLWTPATGMVDLGTLEGESAEALRVNNRGRVFGTALGAGGMRTHAVMWQRAFAVVVPDLNGNGVVEIALLREGPLEFEIRDGSSGALVGRRPFLDDEFVPLDTAALADTDGNGESELAVLAGSMADGQPVIELRNLGTGSLVRQLGFQTGHTGLGLALPGDADADGVPEFAVLSARSADGRGLVEIVNADGTNLRRLWLGEGRRPSKLVALGDADGNGVPDLGVLSTRTSDGQLVVEVINAAGAPLRRSIWLASGHLAVDIAALPDADGNGKPEIAVLSRQISNDRFVVEIRNAAGPANRRRQWLAEGLRGFRLAPLPDADGDGVPELVVAAQRLADGRSVLEVRNAAGTANRRRYLQSAGLRAGELVPFGDSSGDGVPEVLTLFTRGDGRIIAQRRNAAGAAAAASYRFSF
jgi:probable HAF family extracellular repeat protein